MVPKKVRLRGTREGELKKIRVSGHSTKEAGRGGRKTDGFWLVGGVWGCFCVVWSEYISVTGGRSRLCPPRRTEEGPLPANGPGQGWETGQPRLNRKHEISRQKRKKGKGKIEFAALIMYSWGRRQGVTMATEAARSLLFIKISWTKSNVKTRGREKTLLPRGKGEKKRRCKKRGGGDRLAVNSFTTQGVQACPGAGERSGESCRTIRSLKRGTGKLRSVLRANSFIKLGKPSRQKKPG